MVSRHNANAKLKIFVQAEEKGTNEPETKPITTAIQFLVSKVNEQKEPEVVGNMLI